MARSTEVKHEYLNRTQGWIGAITVNRKGDEVSIAVPPGDRVFLTEEERELTDRAPRDRKKSPFYARTIQIFDPMTQEVVEEWVGAPLELQEPEADAQEAAAAAPAPKTPSRPKTAAKRRTRARATA